jgi:hypothetical protein
MELLDQPVLQILGLVVEVVQGQVRLLAPLEPVELVEVVRLKFIGTVTLNLIAGYPTKLY